MANYYKVVHLTSHPFDIRPFGIFWKLPEWVSSKRHDTGPAVTMVTQCAWPLLDMSVYTNISIEY